LRGFILKSKNNKIDIGPYKFLIEKTKISIERNYFGFQFGSKPEGFLINDAIVNKFSSNKKKRSDRKIKEILKYSDMKNSSIEEVANCIDIKINYTSYLLVFFLILFFVFPSSISNSGYFDLFFFLIIIALLYQFDIGRKTTFVFFNLDSILEKKYNNYIASFKKLAESEKIWFIKDRIVKDDKYYKENAGATTSLSIKESSIDFKNRKYVSTNVLPPIVKVNKGSLIFLPGFILDLRKSRRLSDISGNYLNLVFQLVLGKINISVLNYDDLDFKLSYTNFREENTVPKDTEIIKYTSQYVNKDGSRDKRYKNNNKKIPIVKYGILTIKGKNDFNEKLMISNISVVKSFISMIKN